MLSKCFVFDGTCLDAWTRFHHFDLVTRWGAWRSVRKNSQVVLRNWYQNGAAWIVCRLVIAGYLLCPHEASRWTGTDGSTLSFRKTVKIILIIIFNLENNAALYSIIFIFSRFGIMGDSALEIAKWLKVSKCTPGRRGFILFTFCT